VTGEATVHAGGQQLGLRPGESAFIPASQAVRLAATGEVYLTEPGLPTTRSARGQGQP
jgi:mannose-6-phosphate isomerase-like protein (cupin superfamily)